MWYSMEDVDTLDQLCYIVAIDTALGLRSNFTFPMPNSLSKNHDRITFVAMIHLTSLN